MMMAVFGRLPAASNARAASSRLQPVACLMRRLERSTSFLLTGARSTMDKAAILASCSYLNEKIPYERAEAMLLIEVDGDDDESVYRSYLAIGEVCEAQGAEYVYVADNRTTMDRIWNVRRNIAEALKVASPRQSLEDIVVPIAAIPAFMERLEAIKKEYSVEIPCYGHAGDGNLHATVVKPAAWSEAEWHAGLSRILESIYVATHELGGRISGEHGIGNKRKRYIGIDLDSATIALMKSNSF